MRPVVHAGWRLRHPNSPCAWQQRRSVQTSAWSPGRSASPWWWSWRTGLRRCRTPSSGTASCCSPAPRKAELCSGGTASPCNWSQTTSSFGPFCPGAACPWFWRLPSLIKEWGRFTCQDYMVRGQSKDEDLITGLYDILTARSCEKEREFNFNN